MGLEAFLVGLKMGLEVFLIGLKMKLKAKSIFNRIGEGTSC